MLTAMNDECSHLFGLLLAKYEEILLLLRQYEKKAGDTRSEFLKRVENLSGDSSEIFEKLELSFGQEGFPVEVRGQLKSNLLLISNELKAIQGECKKEKEDIRKKILQFHLQKQTYTARRMSCYEGSFIDKKK
ncbi:MAG: hypothetical protein A4E53_00603 [Pelotomaculum sp. PtaB.Bin104]|nr:MAG: hypothetical protein A4E53_00603 [Pelotomaculum sp. PtaB.Bin104]